MAILIDANNVIRSPLPRSFEGLDLARLCELVSGTPWAQDGAVVVCDGHPGPLGLLASPASDVELVWSGRGREADDEIIRRIEEHPHPRSLIVVSSDHAIRDVARERRCAVWRSDEFLLRVLELRQAPPEAAPPDKPDAGRLSPDEVDAWLRRFKLES